MLTLDDIMNLPMDQIAEIDIDVSDYAPTKVNNSYVEDNKIHLCESCQKTYPECNADGFDVLFGDGIGKDNICCCRLYIPLRERIDCNYQKVAL